MPVPGSEDPANWQEFFTADGIPYYYNQVTGETSWDKPACLRTGDDENLSGEWYWIPDEIEGYVKGKLIAENKDGTLHVQTEDGRSFDTPKKVKCDKIMVSSLTKNVDDLVQMDCIDEGMISHNLRKRFQRDQIYTNIGTILISVNPFKRLSIYTPAVMDKYYNRGIRTLPPHIFGIADESYRALVDERKKQSILISGESGAGKTEATKQVLAYLAENAGSSTGVEENILFANPILEAFGNAKTLRNDNSSRFGKFIEILFDKNGQIAGAATSNYLLEKSRVTYHQLGERNYHIFYQMCNTTDEYLLDKYKLSDPNTFKFLNMGGAVLLDGVDDGSEFFDTMTAMEKLGFDRQLIDDILALTAAVMHLGNCDFQEDDNGAGYIVNKEILATASSLLKMDPQQLEHCIVSKTFRVRGQEPTSIPLNAEQSRDNSASFCRMLYGEQFNGLVEHINKAMTVKDREKLNFIGVLDIFGFEIFEENSFEQMCINFCNEKLQQHFNTHTFKLEEALYKSEGIEYSHVTFIDNQPCLDLIEQKPKGLLSALDEEIKMPRGNDTTFLNKIFNHHDRKHPRFAKPLRPPNAFIIKHYAGEVMYIVDGFFEKNKDLLTEDLYKLIESSQLPYLANMFASNGLNRKDSLGRQFKTQLDELMTVLNSTTPHYVRCVKPNDKKVPDEFLGKMCLLQLRYSGVFEAVHIRQTGFPFRWTHSEFIERYKLLTGKAPIKGTTPIQKCEDILSYARNVEDVQMGKTRVLYRAGAHRTLELLRVMEQERRAVVIQASIRRMIARIMHKKIVKLKPKVVAALKTRNLMIIDPLLVQCDEVAFETGFIRDLRTMKHRLEEEKKIAVVMQELVKKDVSSHYDEYCSIINQADEIEMKTKLANEMREILNLETEKREIATLLEEGIKVLDFDLLNEAVNRANGIKYDGPKVQQARESLDQAEREKELAAELEKAMSTGMCHGDDFASIEVEDLQNVIKKAESTNVISKLAKDQLLKANIIYKIRLCLRGEDWETLQQTILESARADLSENEEIVHARQQLALKAAKDDVVEALNQAILEYNDGQLSIKLESAYHLKMEEDPDCAEIVQNAQTLLNQIQHSQAWIKTSMHNVDQAQLLYTKLYSQSFGYYTTIVEELNQLCDFVCQLNYDTIDALEHLDRQKMDNIVCGADQVLMYGVDIEKMRQLLFMPLEKFLQLQLRTAIHKKDSQRVSQITVEIKDEFFALYGTSGFKLNIYGALKTPKMFADASWNPLKKDELKEGFYKWTKVPLHTSMLKLEPQQVKLAIGMFKNILGFMGDKPALYTPTLVSDMLQTAYLNPPIRDEIYCQLMKQLTTNPSRESLAKGWQLMQVLVQTVAPSDDFANVLEIFLRESSPTTENCKAEDFVAHMHTTMFEGSKASANIEEISNTPRKPESERRYATARSITLQCHPRPPKYRRPIDPPTQEDIAALSKPGAHLRKQQRITSSGGASGGKQQQQQQQQQQDEPEIPAVPEGEGENKGKVLYNYEPPEPDSGILSLLAGDELLIMEADPNGWWFCQLLRTGETGYCPGNFIQLI